MDIFERDRYVDILKLMAEKNSGVRGYNSRLSEAASCHSSHLSHVLCERAHLTPDQALAIADFWELPELQSDYFLCLVEWERAGTERLRIKVKRRMDEIRRDAERFHGRSAARDDKERIELSLVDATTYCSHWYYCIVHCLLEIPRFRTVQSLSSHLNLPLHVTESTLKSLERMELAHFDEESLEWRSSRSVKHTVSGDLRTLMNSSQRLFSSYRRELNNKDDLVITMIGALQDSETARAREILLQAFTDISKLKTTDQGPTPEGALMICLDLFVI